MLCLCLCCRRRAAAGTDRRRGDRGRRAGRWRQGAALNRLSSEAGRLWWPVHLSPDDRIPSLHTRRSLNSTPLHSAPLPPPPALHVCSVSHCLSCIFCLRYIAQALTLYVAHAQPNLFVQTSLMHLRFRGPSRVTWAQGFVDGVLHNPIAHYLHEAKNQNERYYICILNYEYETGSQSIAMIASRSMLSYLFTTLAHERSQLVAALDVAIRADLATFRWLHYILNIFRPRKTLFTFSLMIFFRLLI